MKTPPKNGPSKDALEMLNARQPAVAKAVDWNRRLAQYAVLRQDGQVVCVDK